MKRIKFWIYLIINIEYSQQTLNLLWINVVKWSKYSQPEIYDDFIVVCLDYFSLHM